ncbi:hypothetical protein ACFZBU_42290 [Embleya sp. NPDC008237]|uniref:hypothetical protein n=1 Tax=Embleya sp. NPDC008237 TaxID=3363978 RepID=UPI0036DFF468
MKRSLDRHLIRAIGQTRRDDHPFTHGIHARVTFPDKTFADAPAPWHPGPGFDEQTNGSWLRDNGDGTLTGVVCGIGPKEMPSHDGGPWTKEEVWTMTSPNPDHFAYLDDKPHRLTWHVGNPDVTVVREPYPGHPFALHALYWDTFKDRYGFTPQRCPADHGGNYHTDLICAPETWNERHDASDIRTAVLWLSRELDARARITGLVHNRRLRPTPYGEDNPKGYHGSWPQEVERLQDIHWAMNRADGN